MPLKKLRYGSFLSCEKSEMFYAYNKLKEGSHYDVRLQCVKCSLFCFKNGLKPCYIYQQLKVKKTRHKNILTNRLNNFGKIRDLINLLEFRIKLLF